MTMFAASWLWDIFTAKCSVSDYNSTHKFLIDGAKNEAASVTAGASASQTISDTNTETTAVTATSAPAEKTKGETK
jgi:hypothetical protein